MVKMPPGRRGLKINLAKKTIKPALYFLQLFEPPLQKMSGAFFNTFAKLCNPRVFAN
jgi:hypothetical protein